MVVLGWLVMTANAGDVWVSIDAADADGSLKMQIPASCIGTEGNNVVTLANGQTVDVEVALREVQAAKPGTTRSFDVPGDKPGEVAHVTLTHEVPSTIPGATSLLLTVAGPKGAGITVTVPLQKGEIGPMLSDVDLTRIDGLSLKVDDQDTLDIVRRYPPRTLFEVTGKDGGTMRVRSQ